MEIAIFTIIFLAIIFVYQSLLNLDYAEPKQVKYLYVYKSPLNYFFRKPTEEYLIDGEKLRFFGKPIRNTSIPIEPIRIEIVEEEFKTSDNAILKITLILNVIPKYPKKKPSTSSNNDKNKLVELEEFGEEIQKKKNMFKKCVPIFKTNKPKEELIDRLKIVIDDLQNKVFFAEVYHPSRASSMQEVNQGDLMNEFVLNKLRKRDSDISLKVEVEEIANSVLDEYNFEVVKDSCNIYPDADCLKSIPRNLDENNPDYPRYEPLIAYIELFNKIKEIRKDAVTKHKEEMEEKTFKHKEEINQKIIKHSQQLAIDKYKEDSFKMKIVIDEKELESKQNSELKRIESEKKIDKEKIDSKEKIDLEQIASSEKEKINEYEVKKKSLNAKKSIEETELEMNQAVKEQSYISKRNEALVKIKKSEGELEKSNIDFTETILKNRRNLAELQKDFEIPYTWEELSKIEAERLNIELEKLKDDENMIKYKADIRDKKVDFILEYWRHKLERELKLDEHTINLTEKLFLREILLYYNTISTVEKEKILQSLGSSINTALKDSKGLISELKMIRTNNGSNNGDPIVKLLNQVTDGLFNSTAFMPLINSALEELGIKNNNISKRKDLDEFKGEENEKHKEEVISKLDALPDTENQENYKDEEEDISNSNALQGNDIGQVKNELDSKEEKRNDLYSSFFEDEGDDLDS